MKGIKRTLKMDANFAMHGHSTFKQFSLFIFLSHNMFTLIKKEKLNQPEYQIFFCRFYVKRKMLYSFIYEKK